MVMMKIDVDDIKSSNILGITFTAEQDNNKFENHSDVKGNVLVEYQTGEVYRYFNVELATVLNIFSSDSVGSSVNKLIRKYRYERIMVIE